MFEAITPQLFTSGQNAKVFLGTPYKGREIPGKKTITLSGAVYPGQLTINVNAIDFNIYEGTPLPFTSGNLYVADFAPQGSTTLVINRHNLAIASGQACDLWAWIPLFSVKEFSVNGQLGELTDNTVSKLETDKAINAMSKSVSISGPKIFGDPGLKIIDSLQNEFLGYKVKTWLVKALGRGEELLSCSFAKSEQSSQNSFDRVVLGGLAIVELLPPPPPIECQPNTVTLEETLNSNNLIFDSQTLTIVDPSRSPTSSELLNLAQSVTYSSSGSGDGSRWAEVFIQHGGDELAIYRADTIYLTNLFYTPLSDDEIINITFSVDAKFIDEDGYNPNGIAIFPVVKQSGIVYQLNPPWRVMNTATAWQNYSSSFSLASIGVTASAGVPLYFGINRTYQSSNVIPPSPPGVLFQRVGIDNLEFVVNVTCP